MASVYKIVFSGPVGAGKTCAVRTLSDIPVVDTEVRVSDAARRTKAETTVAMDYGVMSLASGDRVRLYGTPGQKRFDFMWEILTENAIGLVLLIDGKAPNPVADLFEYTEAFSKLVSHNALVVGVTHTDWGDRSVRPRIAAGMEQLGLPPVVMNVDARDRADMSALVKTLIYALDVHCTS